MSTQTQRKFLEKTIRREFVRLILNILRYDHDYDYIDFQFVNLEISENIHFYITFKDPALSAKYVTGLCGINAHETGFAYDWYFIDIELKPLLLSSCLGLSDTKIKKMVMFNPIKIMSEFRIRNMYVWKPSVIEFYENLVNDDKLLITKPICYADWEWSKNLNNMNHKLHRLGPLALRALSDAVANFEYV